MYFSLFVGVLSLLCYTLLCAHSTFAIILKRKRKLVALLLFVLQMYCYSKYSVVLPHGAVSWSAVCDCGISLQYSLFGVSYKQAKVYARSTGRRLVKLAQKNVWSG